MPPRRETGEGCSGDVGKACVVFADRPQVYAHYQNTVLTLLQVVTYKQSGQKFPRDYPRLEQQNISQTAVQNDMLQPKYNVPEIEH